MQWDFSLGTQFSHATEHLLVILLSRYVDDLNDEQL